MFPRFLQIHTLHNYTAALLNRDDAGQAKRLPYGNALRTRISSQCLKRHWRETGPLSKKELPALPASLRSRKLVAKEMRQPLEGQIDKEILEAIESVFQKLVYGGKGDTSRQPLLLGVPEVKYLAAQFRKVAEEAVAEGDDAKQAKKRAEDLFESVKDGLKAMRETTQVPAGLAAALFGRMITSDTEANIEAPVYVAHSFTTHASEDEDDYFTVVDDLAEDETGASYIGETELTSGLFYGYTVINIPGLVANLTGISEEEQAEKLTPEQYELAGEVVRRLIHAIAEVSPGAKLGSTAPFGYATTVLVEAGDRQPRSLAGAFRKPTAPRFEEANKAMTDHLAELEENYATNEARRFMSLDKTSEFTGAQRMLLPSLAEWAKDVVISQVPANGHS
ncbi:type I-E CRISPR-associated protein Cas7/Cse4/CasC [Oecophyllibacter saccharovorans]|uniref:Type I-E CRISPR-associated protein Cas7/Cse4/CasC n=1 Tax=Oecophyllibacter saccharovorans TaxID=2558360 RepID=A0A506URM5_9PROT|nr:type I-E CRISPR-associated protein Cas7/Cse4/CasC [Oecophyllibacter saccharovorans]TPW36000.1 type I-E CRISPR-associated protein Cas7/Cse4/CasC [Oecophyllibacter saccharovorans]